MKVLLSADWYEFEVRKELEEYVRNHPDEFGNDFDIDKYYSRYDSTLRTNSGIIALCEKENFPEYVVVEIPDKATDWQLDIHTADTGTPYENIIYVLDGKIHWLGIND